LNRSLFGGFSEDVDEDDSEEERFLSSGQEIWCVGGGGGATTARSGDVASAPFRDDVGPLA
jgi:hypothetical protein